MITALMVLPFMNSAFPCPQLLFGAQFKMLPESMLQIEIHPLFKHTLFIFYYSLPPPPHFFY